MLPEILTFYSQPGPMTEAYTYNSLLDDLPHDIPNLVKAIQGLIVHIYWAERYGLHQSEERKGEVQFRSVWKQLARIKELDPRSLCEPRPLEQRLVGNCRDFATFMAAALRHQHIPARARCGFGTYFTPGKYEDHWVFEYWEPGQGRWVMADAQLDALQLEALGIRFDPLDMPPGQFILAGQAWQMCRMGEANPDDFGIFQWHGMDFVRGNVVRDVLSLNKVEILPWDFFGLLSTELKDTSQEEMELVDRAARLTLEGNPAFAEIRALYEATPRLHVPEEWLAQPS